MFTDRAKPVRADAGVIPETSRYMESWGDSIVANGGKTKALAAELGIVRTAVRVDSMAKYGALSRGDADLYLRFPPPSYREKVWDHAAGVAIVQCAGGVITDGEGRALDFTKGRFLEQRGDHREREPEPTRRRAERAGAKSEEKEKSYYVEKGFWFLGKKKRRDRSAIRSRSRSASASSMHTHAHVHTRTSSA